MTSEADPKFPLVRHFYQGRLEKDTEKFVFRSGLIGTIAFRKDNKNGTLFVGASFVRANSSDFGRATKKAGYETALKRLEGLKTLKTPKKDYKKEAFGSLERYGSMVVDLEALHQQLQKNKIDPEATEQYYKWVAGEGGLSARNWLHVLEACFALDPWVRKSTAAKNKLNTWQTRTQLSETFQKISDLGLLR